jgi:hypothetical protein
LCAITDDADATSKAVDISLQTSDRHDSGVDLSDLPVSSCCSSPFDDVSPDNSFVCSRCYLLGSLSFCLVSVFLLILDSISSTSFILDFCQLLMFFVSFMAAFGTLLCVTNNDRLLFISLMNPYQMVTAVVII